MIDVERTKSAKEWIQKLANGINPLDNAPLSNTDIVNDVHISRCLFYVAEVLDNSMRTRQPRQGKQYESNFVLSNEDLSRVVLAESTGIASFVREVNKVISDKVRPITVAQILQWLMNEGYLVEFILPDNRKTKQATEKGIAIGIQSCWKDSVDGNKYFSTLYNRDAQKFILSNINTMAK